VVFRDLRYLPGLPEDEARRLEEVLEVYEFRVSPYYSSLIDWSDPADPLRQIVLPRTDELDSSMPMDVSNEKENTKVQGLQHKYRPTALLLVSDFCAAYCRFCFRKRFTLATDHDAQIIVTPGEGRRQKETTFDVAEGLAYVAANVEIDNVILTGGDPLMLNPSRLRRIVEGVAAIPHVRVLRVGSKVIAFDPERIGAPMLDCFAPFLGPGRAVYLMAHFNHPRELTPSSRRCIAEVLGRGIQIFNQTPLLKGINAEAGLLAELLGQLSSEGVTPYYVFQCRPTAGNDHLAMSIQDGLGIVEQTRRQLNGLAKTFRFVGSCADGKIEILGRLGDDIAFRFHEARDLGDDGSMFLWPWDREITWFDEPLAAFRAAVGASACGGAPLGSSKQPFRPGAQQAGQEPVEVGGGPPIHVDGEGVDVRRAAEARHHPHPLGPAGGEQGSRPVEPTRQADEAVEAKGADAVERQGGDPLRRRPAALEEVAAHPERSGTGEPRVQVGDIHVPARRPVEHQVEPERAAQPCPGQRPTPAAQPVAHPIQHLPLGGGTPVARRAAVTERVPEELLGDPEDLDPAGRVDEQAGPDAGRETLIGRRHDEILDEDAGRVLGDEPQAALEGGFVAGRNDGDPVAPTGHRGLQDHRALIPGLVQDGT